MSIPINPYSEPIDPVIALGKAWATALRDPLFLLCLQILILPWVL